MTKKHTMHSHNTEVNLINFVNTPKHKNKIVITILFKIKKFINQKINLSIRYVCFQLSVTCNIENELF